MQKCLSDSFLQSVKSQNLISRIYTTLAKPKDDEIFRLALLFFIRALSKGRNVEALLDEGFLTFLQEEYSGLRPAPAQKRTKDAERHLAKLNSHFQTAKFTTQEEDFTRQVITDVLIALTSSQASQAPKIRREISRTTLLPSVLKTLLAQIRLVVPAAAAAAAPSSLSPRTSPKGKAAQGAVKAAQKPAINVGIDRGTLASLERHLTMVENTTFLAPENQEVFVGDPDFLPAVVSLLTVFEDSKTADQMFESPKEATNLLYTIFRVLLNLTNGQPRASQIIGESPEAMNTVLATVLVGSNKADGDTDQFDNLVLGLALLINLVEKNPPNRERVRQAMLGRDSALKLLVSLYNVLLTKAEGYKEINQNTTQDGVVAAYAALLLGCLSVDSPANQGVIFSTAKNGVKGLVDMLEAFLSFNDAVGMKSSKTRDSFLEIIRHLNAFQ